MKLIQLYKIFFILLFISISYSKHVKPTGKEDLYKLSGISTKSTRSYYFLDENGLLYSNLKRYGQDGKNATIKVVSRSQIAPNSNSKKSFGFKLIVKRGKRAVISKELTYNKRASKVTSQQQKGFYFTEAGFWIEEIKIDDKTKIYIKPLDGSSDTFVRVVIDESKERIMKDSKKISTLNRKQKYSIKFENNSGKSIKSHNWFIADDSGDKFKIQGPALIRIFSRYMFNENENSYLDLYSINLFEDEKWVSEYNILPEKSDKNARIVSKDLANYSLGKYKSFYYNVPAGTHYYTLKMPSASKENKFLFKIEEYEIR